MQNQSQRPIRSFIDFIEPISEKLSEIIKLEWNKINQHSNTDLANLIKDALKTTYSLDGEDIAEELAKTGKISVDSKLIAILDKTNKIFAKIFRQKEEKWVKLSGMTEPPLGLIVTHKMLGEFTGKIIQNYPHGQSCVLCKDYYVENNGYKRHAFMLNWEELEKVDYVEIPKKEEKYGYAALPWLGKIEYARNSKVGSQWFDVMSGKVVEITDKDDVFISLKRMKGKNSKVKLYCFASRFLPYEDYLMINNKK